MAGGVALRSATALFLACVAYGFASAALAGAGISWDGAAVLFRVLDDRHFAIVYSRWSNVLVQLFPIALSRVTDNVHAIIVAYGAALGLVRVVALALAWHVVRRSWPQGFIWPALTFAWATLPGEFLMQCEAQEAMALTWPVLFAVLLDPARHRWLIGLLSLFLFFLHPASAGVFLLLSIAAIARRHRIVAVVFFMLCVARLLLLHGGYESAELSLPIIRQHYSSSVGSHVLVVVAGAWLAGLGILAISTIAANQSIRRVVAAGVLVVLAVATYEAVVWARDMPGWANMNDFRTIVPFAAGPLFLLAIGDAIWRGRDDQHGFERPWAIVLAGFTFSLVFSTQAAGWQQVTTRYLSDVRGNPRGCIDMGLLEAKLQATPLWNHTAPALAILLQGKRPDWLVVTNSSCARAQTEIAIAPWYSRPVDRGWFDLTAAGRFPHSNCSIVFRDGWFGPEAAGADRWQWMGTRATLEVNASDSDYPLTISGYVLSIAQPNVIHIAAGSADAGNIVATGFRTPFAPVTLGVPAARQLVTLTSEHAGAPQPHDPRPLAAALGNPVVLTRTGDRCRITGG